MKHFSDDLTNEMQQQLDELRERVESQHVNLWDTDGNLIFDKRVKVTRYENGDHCIFCGTAQEIAGGAFVLGRWSATDGSFEYGGTESRAFEPDEQVLIYLERPKLTTL